MLFERTDDQHNSMESLDTVCSWAVMGCSVVVMLALPVRRHLKERRWLSDIHDVVYYLGNAAFGMRGILAILTRMDCLTGLLSGCSPLWAAFGDPTPFVPLYTLTMKQPITPPSEPLARLVENIMHSYGDIAMMLPGVVAAWILLVAASYIRSSVRGVLGPAVYRTAARTCLLAGVCTVAKFAISAVVREYRRCR